MYSQKVPGRPGRRAARRRGGGQPLPGLVDGGGRTGGIGRAGQPGRCGGPHRPEQRAGLPVPRPPALVRNLARIWRSAHQRRPSCPRPRARCSISTRRLRRSGTGGSWVSSLTVLLTARVQLKRRPKTKLPPKRGKQSMTCGFSGSGWRDLNPRPLRPERQSGP
jgi:hypothetical protein